MKDTELKLLKRLLNRLIKSPLATDNVIYRTAKGLLMRLMR